MVKGDFKNTSRFLSKMKRIMLYFDADRYGRMGVAALQEATPKRTGKTAASWDYKVTRKPDSLIIDWTNSNISEGTSVAILIQYGHGTGYGVYVSGIDYINPALKPVFNKIAEEAWKEVTRS